MPNAFIAHIQQTAQHIKPRAESRELRAENRSNDGTKNEENEEEKTRINMEKCYRSTCFIPFLNDLCIIVAHSTLATWLLVFLTDWHGTEW